MIEWLVSIDSALFRFFNKALANAVFDLVMPAVTNDWFLRAVFLVIVIALAIFGGRKGRITAVLCIVTVAATDQLAANLIKPLVGRVRPCHEIPDVHLLVDCSSGLAFPSAHASNVFGQAVAIGFRHRRAALVLYPFAALVSYSRVAVGVHYPGDILAGAILGAITGLAIVISYRIASRTILRSREKGK